MGYGAATYVYSFCRSLVSCTIDTYRGKGQSFMTRFPTIVIGAGIGGLSCAATLAARGEPVMVLEAGAYPGGRMRETHPGPHPVDSGPTVLTLPRVFEEIFSAAGERLKDHLTFDPLTVLARHAWNESEQLDLFADHKLSKQAIAEFAGGRAADGFQQFCNEAKQLYQVLYPTFMTAQKPSLLGLASQIGPFGAMRLRAGAPFQSLWDTLGRYFPDPRLRQLFGRYATYVGSSPYLAPAVLMLIAQVEMEGVYAVKGGMAELARALAELCRRKGVEFRYGQRVVRIHKERGRVNAVECADGSLHSAGAIVYNGEPMALASGQMGTDVREAVNRELSDIEPSLSALTYAWSAKVKHFPLDYHTVFFSKDYSQEFKEIGDERKLPSDPTVYLCAQDRNPGWEKKRVDNPSSCNPERIFAIINAPALRHPRKKEGLAPSKEEIAATKVAAIKRMHDCGLQLEIEDEVCTGPAEFARLFPGNGGALYGQACHGWNAPFKRPGSRSLIPGLYLAGGGIHPGPGVPMVALSGRLAALAVLRDQGKR